MTPQEALARALAAGGTDPRAVEAELANAGHIIVSTARAAGLLAVERAALALARSEWRMADPWPAADALVKALKDSGAEKHNG